MLKCNASDKWTSHKKPAFKGTLEVEHYVMRTARGGSERIPAWTVRSA